MKCLMTKKVDQLAKFADLTGGLARKSGGGVFEGGGGVDYPNAHYEIYQYLIMYIILFFCLHQCDLLN